jgi:hypothetical protein
MDGLGSKTSLGIRPISWGRTDSIFHKFIYFSAGEKEKELMIEEANVALPKGGKFFCFCVCGTIFS